MYFNSLEFIFLFFPITFIVYFYLNKIHLIAASRLWLVLCSLFFYGYWKVEYVFLIMTSIFVNFILGNILSTRKIKSRRIVLIGGIVLNLSLLGYYKYANFFVENINTLLNSNVNIEKIVLPLAISFFTFQQIAYLVDSYKRETKEYDFINYALFVTFFPQLIAGPIVHHKEIIPQFKNKRAKFINYQNLSMGVYAFVIGLIKKVLIADNLAVIVGQGFNNYQSLSTEVAWVSSISYTFQLYFDFSGYCDMAYGLALMFNIILPINFNSPYQAINIQDFWRRWHITLSKWLQNYIYIPLGGNRKSNLRTYINLFVVFVICGIWHGAGWTFILWGVMHGIAMLFYRFYKNNLSSLLPVHPLMAWFITFNFVNVAWVFFRADSVSQALTITSKLYDIANYKEILWLVIVLFIVVTSKNIYNQKQQLSKLEAMFIGVGLFACIVSMLTVYRSSPFL